MLTFGQVVINILGKSPALAEKVEENAYFDAYCKLLNEFKTDNRAFYKKYKKYYY